jgi:ABC-type cobalt transport system substrate-binding protein
MRKAYLLATIIFCLIFVLIAFKDVNGYNGTDNTAETNKIESSL